MLTRYANDTDSCLKVHVKFKLVIWCFWRYSFNGDRTTERAYRGICCSTLPIFHKQACLHTAQARDQYYKTEYAITQITARFWFIIIGDKWVQISTYLHLH